MQAQNGKITAPRGRKRRVFCIGLDGGTWTVLRPLMEAGHMPNLTALSQRGVSGVLHSTVPPITPAAWSTFMTGCNPGKHGIFDFQGFDRHQREGYLVNATSLRVPTLWQILSEHGLRVAVVDLPVTYPPPAINGVIVSGLMTPNRNSIFTHPAALRDELEAHLGYEWPLLKEEDGSNSLHGDFDAFLEQMQLFITSRVAAMLYLLAKEAWDFAFLQFQCVDFLQHPFWKYLDQAHPEFDHERYRQIVKKFFVPLDRALGKLLAAVQKYQGEETLVLALSDHGFQRHRVCVELNHWLYQQGFLAAQAQPKAFWMRWAETVRRLDVLQLRKLFLRKSRQKAMARTLRQSSIDHERSVAYAFSSFWGYLYLGARASENEIHNLANELHAWRDPETGRPIVRKLHYTRESFCGEALERLPDIILEPEPGYTFSSKTYFRSGEIFSPVSSEHFHTGTHAEDGIFMIAGPNIPAIGPRQLHEGDLQDMMPTLLHWLGLPVPKHCDGRVRLEWLEGKKRKPKINYAEARAQVQDEVRLSDEEQQEIEKRLQNLGYM